MFRLPQKPEILDQYYKTGKGKSPYPLGLRFGPLTRGRRLFGRWLNGPCLTGSHPGRSQPRGSFGAVLLLRDQNRQDGLLDVALVRNEVKVLFGLQY